MKNPFSHIATTLFTDYSLPVGLPVPALFLPAGKGVERREEKRREEKRREEKEATSEIFNSGFFQKWVPP